MNASTKFKFYLMTVLRGNVQEWLEKTDVIKQSEFTKM